MHVVRRIYKILSHVILLQGKLDYTPNVLLQTGCLTKFSWAKPAIFGIFQFFEYNCQTIHFKRKILAT